MGGDWIILVIRVDSVLQVKVMPRNGPPVSQALTNVERAVVELLCALYRCLLEYLFPSNVAQDHSDMPVNSESQRVAEGEGSWEPFSHGHQPRQFIQRDDSVNSEAPEDEDSSSGEHDEDRASGRLREDLCGDVTRRTLTPRVSRNPSYGGILPPKDLAMDPVSSKKRDRGSFQDILPDKWF